MVMARNVTRFFDRASGKLGWPITSVAYTLLFAALIGSVLVLNSSGWERLTSSEIGWMLVFDAMALAGLILSFRNQQAVSLLSCASMIGIMVLCASTTVLPNLGSSFSARHAAKQVGGEPARENLYVYRLHRAWVYGLSFYQKKKLSEWTEDAPLPAWVYTNYEGREILEGKGRAVRVVEGGSGEVGLMYVYR